MEENRLQTLRLLRRVRDRIDREHAEPLDVEALARGVAMSSGHLSRQFRTAYGESPYAYLMTRRVERAMGLTVNASSLPLDDPDATLLGPPGADPGITDDERRTIADMMAKGTYGWLMLATSDLDSTFEEVVAGGAEVVQEPTDQPWGTRDCAFRDPSGTMIRIQELH